MADIPQVRTRWIDENGRPTPWFYNFLNDLNRLAGADTGTSDSGDTTNIISLGSSGSGESVYQVETSSNYTVTGAFDHEVVVCTNASTSVTITMPNLYEGAKVSVIRAGAGSVAITSTDTILGLTTQYLPLQYDSADMRGTTSEWVLT